MGEKTPRSISGCPLARAWPSCRAPAYGSDQGSATPTLIRQSGDRIVLQGVVPSPRDPPTGRPFHPRRWKPSEIRATSHPPTEEDAPHRYRCYHFGSGLG